jgi:hypothetical protein
MQHLPFVGVITKPQFLHWYLSRQKSVGIISGLSKPHFGQCTTDSRMIFFSLPSFTLLMQIDFSSQNRLANSGVDQCLEQV